MWYWWVGGVVKRMNECGTVTVVQKDLGGQGRLR